MFVYYLIIFYPSSIDIKGVTHVVNYELPSKIENYSHRIGMLENSRKEDEELNEFLLFTINSSLNKLFIVQ